MDAGFGDKRFYSVGPNFFPEGTPFYLDGRRRAERQQQSGKWPRRWPPRPACKGQPIRILASRQYGFHYNMALVSPSS